MKKTLLSLFTLFCVVSALSLHAAEVITSPSDSYTIVEALGQGAFGTVYKVQNQAGDELALKEYHPQDEDGGAFWTLLGDIEREFQLGQTFDHPHIIHSIEFFQDSSSQTFYLVLELVNGKPIGEMEKGEMNPAQAYEAAADLNSALNYAYQMGYYYLDLHEWNVMWSETSSTQMIDLAGFFSAEELCKIFFQLSLDESSEVAKGIAPQRVEKVKRLLAQNPELATSIKKEVRKTEQVKAAPIQLLTYFNPWYITRVTDMGIELVRKGQLDKMARIQARLALKMIEWNYLEDVEEPGGDPSIDKPFSAMEVILKQYCE